jgi:c-di-GMP-binding flagellar brake protein YcgR
MEDPTTSRPDRRQHERKVLRCAAYLLLPDRPPLAVRVLDICVDGMGIVAPANLPTSANCGIRFVMPLVPRAGARVEAQVQVIYSAYSSGEDGFRIGLRFTSLSPEMASAISRFMKA